MKLLNFTIRATFGLAIIAGLVLLALNLFGLRLYSVQSGSMSPAIDVGDMLVSRPFDASKINEGDVITFAPDLSTPTYTVTHRVVSIDRANKQITTKGDANTTPDESIAYSQVVGQLPAPYRAGIHLDILRSWVGLIIFIYVPAIILTLDEIKRLNKHYEKVLYTRSQRRATFAKGFIIGVALISAASPVMAGLGFCSTRSTFNHNYHRVG